MASGSKVHSDSVVKERRLRPIYELLDISMNKKVVQEVDRLLKKQPNFTCAKVLKALALLRMGKTDECLGILDPIIKDVPTDENTIQALSICYRELDQPQMVCQILEQACKNEKSEDLLSNCFMAYTRVGDFQKQHQTALTLYKLCPKTPYFSWAIMSLYAKAERESDPLVTRVSLPLAERMMAKFIEENKVETEHELTLYALILRKQQKYEKVLEILDTSFGKLQLSECAGFYNKYKIECLANLNKHEELASFMESNLRKTPDDYNNYAEYIKTFGETQTERVTEFMAEMRAKDSNRSSLLACLYLYQFLFDRGMNSKANIDPISIFKEYAERFGNKPSFFMDLCGFLSGLQKEDAKEAFLAIMKDFIKIPIDYMNANDVQRHVNHRYMSRFFTNRKQRADPVKILGYVQHNIGLYLDGSEAIETARKTSGQMDEAIIDEFALLSCLMLVDSIWFEPELWHGVFKVISEKGKSQLESSGDAVRRNLLEKYSSRDPNANLASDLVICRTSDAAMEKGDSLNEDGPRKSIDSKTAETGQSKSELDGSILTNGISRLNIDGDQANISEEDFPILLCLSLLEYAIERSPKNAQLLLQLSKLYIRCGAIGAGADAVVALDVKHMQWESLGYLYVWKLTSGGYYNAAARTLKLVESFFTSYQKESMEFVISAYKYGSWEKILEFMDFRDLLLNSVQFGMLKVERQLLEYSKNTSRPMEASDVAQSSELASVNLNGNFTDSRDFSVMLTYTEEKVTEEQTSRSFQADLRKLRVRGVIASLIDQFVLSQGDGGVGTRSERIDQLLKDLTEYVQEDYSVFNITQIPVDGMWPPRILEYKSFGHLELLLNMLKLTYEVAKDSAALTTTLTENVSKISNQVTEKLIKSWVSSRHTLLNRAARLENACDYIETLGLCCTLLDVCHTYVTKTVTTNGKTKKKKSKEVGSNSSNLKHFTALTDTLIGCMKQVEQALLSSPLMTAESFPSFAASSEFWAGVVGNDITTHILPYSYPVVIRKLQLSYDRSMSELTKNLDKKIKHLQRISAS